MTNLKSVMQDGDRMVAVLSDGSKMVAFPTGSGTWIFKGEAGPPDPPDPPEGDWVHPLGKSWPYTTYEDGGGSHSAGALDFPCGTDTPPLFAAHAGPILYAGWEDGGGGNVVVIGGPDGEGITYAHLSRIDVTVGQQVTAGQTVGLVGTTGNSSGNHLHLEVRKNGVVWGSWHRALEYFASKGVTL